MSDELKNEELEAVSGGWRGEIEEIVAAFRSRGYEEQARVLETAGALDFSKKLKSVLADMGFHQSLHVKADGIGPNYNNLNGTSTEHYRVMEVLNEFLDSAVR